MHNLHTQRLHSCKKKQSATPVHLEKTGTKRPAPIITQLESKDGPANLVSEGGYPSSRPSAPPASSSSMDHTPPTEAKRRNWRQDVPQSTASPPCGVEPATTSPSSQSSQGEQAASSAAAVQVTSRQSPRKPCAVKSKAVKPRSCAESQATAQHPRAGPTTSTTCTLSSSNRCAHRTGWPGSC